MDEDEPDGAESVQEPTPVVRERRRMQVDGVAFGQRVHELRRRRGWSVHDLHDVTGIAAATISNLERGKTRNPDPWVTHALALAFGCPSAGDMVAWLAARERGEPYAPAGGAAPPYGPPRVPVAPPARETWTVGDVRLDVLVEQLLRGYWRAAAGGAARGQVTQLTTLGVGLWLLTPPGRGSQKPRRRAPHRARRPGTAVSRGAYP